MAMAMAMAMTMTIAIAIAIAMAMAMAKLRYNQKVGCHHCPALKLHPQAMHWHSIGMSSQTIGSDTADCFRCFATRRN